METFSKALSLLTPSERRRGILVLLIVAFTGIFEVVGVASVLPFLSVLSNPSLVETNELLNKLYLILDLEDIDQFLYFLGISAFILIILASAIRTLGLYVVIRFAQMRRHSIAARLLEIHLRQPYEFFIGRHSGELAKGILSEIDQVIAGYFQPMATMIAQIFTLVALIFFLVIVDPFVALIAGLSLGSAYGLIFFLIKAFQSRIGKAQIDRNKRRFEATTEVLGGIKVIKLMGRENMYLQRFIKPSYDMAYYISINQVLAQIPKFTIEALAFGGILFLSLILMIRYGGHEANALGQVLPLLALYAFAGYRLLPAIQSIYFSLTQAEFWSPAIDNIYKDLKNDQDLPLLEKEEVVRLPLKKNINIENLTFFYPNSEGVGINDLTIEIPAGSILGIVGSTGSGKTTLADICLGLLRPSSGIFKVDGVEIVDANIRNWQANIGYVPQDIFLTDSSVKSNIAMGIEEDKIDLTRVTKCAELASIKDFIEEELQDSYNSEIGERGLRLSGGQIQRIGIARALYHNPDFLVFDEATSALDNITEGKVMNSITSLKDKKTMILIAHRLSTLKDCDQILVMEKGKKVGLGTFEDLVNNNTFFQEYTKNINELKIN